MKVLIEMTSDCLRVNLNVDAEEKIVRVNQIDSLHWMNHMMIDSALVDTRVA